jgi:hypothetical protein
MINFCYLDDDDNLVNDDDDLPAIQKQCLLVRNMMNETISSLSVETTQWENDLVLSKSQVPNAGWVCFVIILLKLNQV